jgi:molybdate/tungstate transport system permease protein
VTRRRPPWTRIGVWLWTAAALVAVLLPVEALLAHASAGSLVAAWQAARQGPLTVSLTSSAAALALCLFLGSPLAYALARGSAGVATTLLELALLLPLLLPPLVVGLVLAYVLGPSSLWGTLLLRLGLNGLNSWPALTAAAFYESVPYYVLAAAAALAQVDPEAEAQAATLGRPPWWVARHVLLPRIAPGLSAALAMAWARAMGAFGAAVVVAYHPTGMPVAIWIALQEWGLGTALPLALVLLAVSLPLPLAARAIYGRLWL